MKFRILSALLRSAWAIDERYAIAHGSLVAGLINGIEGDFSESIEMIEDKKTIPFAIDRNDPGTQYSIYDDAPQGSIAIIPVTGALMKADEWCSVGMDTLGKRVQEADLHPNISGIVLYMDTPGGTVDGTQAFADKVKNCETPVVTFIDGLMASAGLWVGTSADKVVAQNSTTEIGSIGVMVGFADMQPMWEAEGVKFHRINADQSKDKNKTYYDALKGDYKGIKEMELNPLADMFIAAVKENRANLPESVFTGKVYFAEEALSLGLIDEIGSFERAVELVSELAAQKDPNNQQNKNSQSSKNKKIQNKMDAPLLIDLLKVQGIESTEEGVYLREEEVVAIETRLAADQVVISGIDAAVSTAVETAVSETVIAHNATVEELANAKASLTTAEEARNQELAAREAAEGNLNLVLSELDEIHPEVAEAETINDKVAVIRTILARKPGAKPVGVKSENDTNPSPDGVNHEILDNLPHMQEETD